ncbi:hypothetical protein [Marimonas arenosa]|uniref:Uncharacterized protein n=1 Tax=Marimonas arenosa TaxID=1795305 RepID=A0AAE3WAM9_9RHOB|nr:hypothetical protein [Marimonas arenosa]MDQ2089232.1 hypothetical protein [Marimonas arenosa]
MKHAGWKGVRQYARATRMWARRHIPPGLRLVLGLALIVGGVFGFLPVLGFWMIPLGIAVAAADVLPIWRWWAGRDR